MGKKKGRKVSIRRKSNSSKKLTSKQIKDFAKDEKEARETYKKLGLNEMSNDENDHYKYFKNIEKKMKQKLKKK